MSRQLDELNLQLGSRLLVRPSQEMADYALRLSGRARIAYGKYQADHSLQPYS